MRLHHVAARLPQQHRESPSAGRAIANTAKRGAESDAYDVGVKPWRKGGCARILANKPSAQTDRHLKTGNSGDAPERHQHLKILLLIVVILNLNFLWLKHVPINNIWISSLLRTVVLMGGGCAVAWAKNLSPEINQQIQSFITKH